FFEIFPGRGRWASSALSRAELGGVSGRRLIERNSISSGTPGRTRGPRVASPGGRAGTAMTDPTPSAPAPPEPTLPAGDPAGRLRRLWDEGRARDVDAFLAQAGPLAPGQAAAVLRVDQRGRWQAGDPVPAEDYLRRHPSVAVDPDAAADLIYNEYLLREARGD